MSSPYERYFITEPAVIEAELDQEIAEAQWVAECWQHSPEARMEAAHRENVREALWFAEAFGTDPDKEYLSPMHSRLITLALEVKRLRGAA